MIVVTGAAGFIGSCIIARLIEKGTSDIIAVDRLNDDRSVEGDVDLKRKNIEHKSVVEFIDKETFLNYIASGERKYTIEAVIHMGACSSTTLDDADYFKKNNFEYTKTLAEWTLANNVRFIYASSAATYGDGSIGYKDDDTTIRKCRPLNLYGQSKQDFDAWALENSLLNQVAGLKFFNVFGPNEYHKGDMRSVVCKSYAQVAEQGKIRLFKSYKSEYADGEQKRDFIYVKDAVDVILFFLKKKDVSGIFNVGTGQARSWNDLAGALFAAVGKKPDIEYFDMPETLRDKYQYFTQADMSKLRRVGYDKEFTSLEGAVKDYVGYLKEQKHW